jgi:hypothetical protein
VRDLEQDSPLPGVEVDWKEAVSSIHSRRARSDRGRHWRRCCLRSCYGGVREAGEQAEREPTLAHS